MKRQTIVALAAAAMLAGLAGCKTVPVVQKEYILVEVPSYLVTRIEPAPAPDRTLYKAADLSSIEDRLKRRLSLTLDLSQNLYKDLDMCNKRLFMIEQVQTKAKAEVEKLNGANNGTK